MDRCWVGMAVAVTEARVSAQRRIAICESGESGEEEDDDSRRSEEKSLLIFKHWKADMKESR